jgi:tRNA-dihydrouridine synthase B
MFSLGDLHLSIPFVLAPMSGVSDLPFRLITREFGCPLAFAEMISARALYEKNQKTLKLLETSSTDRPLGIQLLTRDPYFLAHAIELLEAYDYDILDLNAACPVRKVTRKGEGAALLKEPAKLSELVETLVKHARVPVTVKIRSGWDDTSVNAREIAARIEDAGADAVCIHGRTRQQGYGGKADLKVIGEVKATVKIPVLASGDIFSGDAAIRMIRETGCDAVMVARGALGNPWIFNRLESAFQEGTDGKNPGPLPGELKAVMKKHVSMSVECHGEKLGIVNFRKFFISYIKGLRRARALRYAGGTITSLEEMMKLIDAIGRPRSPGSSHPVSQASPCDLHQESTRAPSRGSLC